MRENFSVFLDVFGLNYNSLRIRKSMSIMMIIAMHKDRVIISFAIVVLHIEKILNCQKVRNSDLKLLGKGHGAVCTIDILIVCQIKPSSGQTLPKCGWDVYIILVHTYTYTEALLIQFTVLKRDRIEDFTLAPVRV
jgi:hypothetical protein